MESVLNPLAQFYGQPLELRLQLAGKTSRLFDGGLHYQSSYRIEIVRHATKPNPDRLERNASSAGSRIQNGQTSQIVANCGLQPVRVTAIQRVTEGPVVAIRIGDSDAAPPRPVDDPLRCYRISVNPEHMQNLLPVSIPGQQGSQNGRACRHQGPPRPPDVLPVRCGKRRHGRPLARALDTNLRNGQPPLDQTGVLSSSVGLSSVALRDDMLPASAIRSATN